MEDAVNPGWEEEAGRPRRAQRPVNGAEAPRHFHVCAFFDSRDEAYQVLAPLDREAQCRRERSLHFVAPAAVEEHRGRLQAVGVDVAGCEACGQLALRAWPGDGSRFDLHELLALMAQAVAHGEPIGAALRAPLRVTSQMGWTMRDGIDRLDVLEYEARLNVLLDQHDQPAICVYDLARLDGATMMDLLRTHPSTLIGGVLRENPFFTPPAEMLRELSARRAMGRRRGLPPLAAMPPATPGVAPAPTNERPTG